MRFFFALVLGVAAAARSIRARSGVVERQAVQAGTSQNLGWSPEDFDIDMPPDQNQTSVTDYPTVGSEKGERICNVGGKADEGPLVETIHWQRDYLNSLYVSCDVDSPPGTCSRISCSNNAAVWLCNDRDDRLEVPCDTLGSWVDDITDNCQEEIHHGHVTARGQLFEKSKSYNVIVGFDDC